MGSTADKRNLECVDIMVLDSSGEMREEVAPDGLSTYLADEEALIWCDVYSHEGGQGGEYGRFLSETFGFDELTVEDCFTLSHLPKVDDYGEYLFVVLFSFHLSDKQSSRVHTIELDMYVGRNYVVCVHSRPLRELKRAREGLRGKDKFISASAANLAHTVLDAVVDEYLPIMDRLSALSDDIEERLLRDVKGDSERVLDELFDLKHLLTALRRVALPQRDSTTTLLRPATSIIPEESHRYFQDVRDHLDRVIDSIDTMRDYLASTLEIYTTRATQRINNSLQRLTAISTVILPLTFITSVYGMNFSNMPELNTRYGYFVVLSVLLLLGVTMIYFLRRNRML